MQRKLPDAIRNMPNLKDMRAMGIDLAARKVFEKDYEEAKRLFKSRIKNLTSGVSGISKL